MRMNPRYLLAAPALALVLTMIPACGDDSGGNSGSTVPAITDSTPVEPSSGAPTSASAETTAPVATSSAATTGS